MHGCFKVNGSVDNGPDDNDTVDDGMAGDDTVADDAVADDAVADCAVADDVVNNSVPIFCRVMEHITSDLYGGNTLFRWYESGWTWSQP